MVAAVSGRVGSYTTSAQVAQSAEQRFCKPQVVGSSPTLGSPNGERAIRRRDSPRTRLMIVALSAIWASNKAGDASDCFIPEREGNEQCRR